MSSPLPSTTPPQPSSLPPLLRLATELHLAIISFLPDLKDTRDEHDVALLQLRRTNHYFRGLVPRPTHDDLLSLEWALSKYSVYACQFCRYLRPGNKFAAAMLKGPKGINGASRYKRFCADCGFDTTVVGKSQRYCPGTRACVGGVDWVWCKYCKIVKKGEEAEAMCVGLCRACYGRWGCRCRDGCGRTLHNTTTPLHQRTLRPPPPSRMLPELICGGIRVIASDEDSDGYDSWERQLDLCQQEDDDWRSL
jgi:hypothetical protein